MDAPNAPYLRLDGRTLLEEGVPEGWAGGTLSGLTGAPGGHLALEALAGGRLALDSRDDSLGGLRLPPLLAVDGDARVYLLDRERARILRYSGRRGRFAPLPAIGGDGNDPRAFTLPRAIAATGRRLYVADAGDVHRGGRVQVFDTTTLVLVEIFITGDALLAPGEAPWRPSDLVAHGPFVYVLDGPGARVWRHAHDRERLELVLDLSSHRDAPFDWLLVDRRGRVFLRKPGSAGGEPAKLIGFAPDGSAVATVSQPHEIRAEVEPPPVLLDDQLRFCLPASLTALCPSPAPPAALARPLGRCAPFAEGGQVFDLSGRAQVVAPDEAWGSPLFAREGHWLSRALDGLRLGRRWHRVVLHFAQFPPGARVEIRTRTGDELGAIDPHRVERDAWDLGFRAAAPTQAEPGAHRDLVLDGLVQSPPGRYLWLRLDLQGDGFATPALTAAEVAYGGDTWLDFLPAVFREDLEGRTFLERYLALFQTEWDGLAGRIDTLGRLLDPRTTPATFLDHLASWLDLELEPRLDEVAKRRLLEVVRGSLQQRGTIAALRVYLQAYLGAITGRDPDQLHGFPQILEGSRERAWLRLGEPGARLGEAVPLWSEDRVGRVRLGTPIRQGAARILSLGEPWRDVFDAHAHRFRVFVPATWLADEDDAAMLERAIEREKPAHARHRLHLVRPGMIVGRKASLGLDTILSDRRPLRLVCERGKRDQSRIPAPRLGIDALVASRPAGGVRIERHLALGERQVVL